MSGFTWFLTIAISLSVWFLIVLARRAMEIISLMSSMQTRLDALLMLSEDIRHDVRLVGDCHSVLEIISISSGETAEFVQQMANEVGDQDVERSHRLGEKSLLPGQRAQIKAVQERLDELIATVNVGLQGRLDEIAKNTR